MTTIALFNNKGGVGKTTLAYHLAHMIARLGWRVLAVDLDPQANLTAFFFEEEELEELWERDGIDGTVYDGVRPIVSGTGDIKVPRAREVADRLFALPGDLALARFEDKLSQAWPGSFTARDEAALRTTTSFHRIMTGVSKAHLPHVTLIDVGPNLGAINRAALLSSDWILVPLAADLFSLQGLRNLGPTLKAWRIDWAMALQRSTVDFDIPTGTMRPLGYVVLQPSIRLDRPVKAYGRWLARIPAEFHAQLLDQRYEGQRPEDDEFQLAILRNYRSLMPLAQDARKPMFDLKASDGALGSTARFVEACYQDFERLARHVAAAAGVPPASLPSTPHDAPRLHSG